MSRIAAAGTGLPLAMSANCSTPPGRSTRRISANTAALSAHRLITPLEITTSRPAVVDRQGFGQALADLHPVQAQLADGAPGLGQHLGGHVHADHPAARTD